MTTNSNRDESGQRERANDPPHASSTRQGASTRQGVGRKIGLAAIFLVISSIVFCAIVVRQRDIGRKESSLKWAKKIQVRLQGILDERKFLPRTLPDDLGVVPEELRLPYPSPEEVSRLETSDKPFMVVVGPHVGLIMPGRDGCAAVVFDAGRVEAAWLTVAEVDAAQERRAMLALGPPESD